MTLLLYPSLFENVKLLYKKPIWNKGLTKETDPRVKIQSEKMKNREVSLETREKQRQAKLGKKQSPEHIKKRTRSQIGRIKLSEEIEKIRQIHLGRKLSSENKEIVRRTHLGKKESKETREKKRIASTGRHHSLESIDKTRQKLKGRKHTPESIEKNRQSQIRGGKHIGRICSERSGCGNGDYHLTPNQGSVWMRSSWEIAYAKYLEQNNIDYWYEVYTFPMVVNNKNTTYRPDFLLPTQNKFIEIKGRKDYEHWEYCSSKQKSDKFKSDFCQNWSYEVLFFKELKILKIL